MHRATVFVCLALATAAAAVGAASHDGGDLLDRVLDRCSPGPGAVRCMKTNVLDYLEGGRPAAGRSLGDGDDTDDEMVRAASAYIGRRVDGPPSGRAMDEMAQQQQQQQAAATTTTTARADMEMGMMQDKMLMPLMMMMKMKLKMLMPIMMALVSMKATKALVLSKVAIFMVLGFLVKEFLKKSGGLPGLPMIHLPGLPGASSEPPSTASPPMYGPPQSSGYEAPSSWEPTGYSSSSSGHHSSSDAGSHSMAYSSYLPSSSSSSSASLSASKY